MRFARSLPTVLLTLLLLAPEVLQTARLSAQPAEEKKKNFNPDGKLPWLGVSRWMANQQEVVLCGVLRDGPAGKAGLQIDDVVAAINHQPVPDIRAFHTLIDGLAVGQAVPVEIKRGDQPMTVEVVMEPLPADGGISRLVQAIEAGEAWAMMEMGIRLMNARGDRSYIEKDLAAAAAWFWRAVDAGDTAAPLFLAKMYVRGEGVERDFAVAQELLMMARKRAAEADRTGVHRGLASAASSELARMCLSGQGPHARPELAVPLLEDAARHGGLYAMTELGGLYEKGVSVPHDEAKMKYWYTLAAKQNYPRAVEAVRRLRLDVAADSAAPSAPTRAAASVATAVPDGRYVWSQKGGFFRACGNRRWIESFRPPAGPGGFLFEETSRNEQFVELHDHSRNATVRLFSDHAQLRDRNHPEFTRMYDGHWMTVVPGGR